MQFMSMNCSPMTLQSNVIPENFLTTLEPIPASYADQHQDAPHRHLSLLQSLLFASRKANFCAEQTCLYVSPNSICLISSPLNLCAIGPLDIRKGAGATSKFLVYAFLAQCAPVDSCYMCHHLLCRAMQSYALKLCID